MALKISSTQKKILLSAEEFVKNLQGKETTGHDWHHVDRVRNMAKKIAQSEGANLFVVQLSALLHDVDDPKITLPENSQNAQKFLFSYDQKDVPGAQILEIIETLSFSSYLSGKSESTLEGKIVQDADRLDALGAIGIARTFAYGGAKHRPIFNGSFEDESSIAHFYEKLLKLPELMNGEYARKLAFKRVAFMKRFLKRFYREWNGDHY